MDRGGRERTDTGRVTSIMPSTARHAPRDLVVTASSVHEAPRRGGHGERFADFANDVGRLVLRLVIRARLQLGQQPERESCTPVKTSRMPNSSSGRLAID